MSLKLAIEQLDWYSEDEIKNPSGAGAKFFLDLVQRKIAQTVRTEKKIDLEIGLLVNDPTSDSTQTPLAIVCEFKEAIDLETLDLTHRLAWNFCRSPLLIIVEPSQVRALSCYTRPEDRFLGDSKKFPLFDSEVLGRPHGAQILEFPLDATHDAHRAAESLRWIELFSGQFFRDNASHFPTKQRVDYVLLENLRYIRSELTNLELDEDVIHDLLARLIFIQFLFQRKDSKGKPAIDDAFLKVLSTGGFILQTYQDLPSLLRSKEDTYRFFRWLNNKFNGDLFPGQGETTEEREAEWLHEMELVSDAHLHLLADFISGKVRMKSGQLCLWEMYSFDVIPLEFISSVYEVFVSKEQGRGVHYTPSLLVDFILDNPKVLPWKGQEWDLKVMDPACGSGIFLVKAFQRLVQRWRNANPEKKPGVKFLLSLLKNNLFGLDINPHAARVASFSLYLAVCDEIDPRRYWEKWEFPRMRGHQIRVQDFFEEAPLFENHGLFDLVIGNAPWGKGTVFKSEAAIRWSGKSGWNPPYGDIGPLFLPRAGVSTKAGGVIAMVQPVNSLLFNESAIGFRQKLFSTLRVDEITNLSTLRFNLFNDATSPSCIVIVVNTEPDGRPITYICPKGTQTNEDKESILVEPQDVHYVHPEDAYNDQLIWTALLWGGKRDVSLLKKLNKKMSFQKLLDEGILDPKKNKRRGVERGKNPTKRQDGILGWKILEEEGFPLGTFLFLHAEELKTNYDPWTYERDSTSYEAFKLPQLILKLGWQTEIRRFRGVMVDSRDKKGILCSHIYLSVHSEDQRLLESACLAYNSKVAVYYLLLASGQFATYRPKITLKQALSVPFELRRSESLARIESFDDIDSEVYESFSLKASERILVEDLVNFTLPDFKGKLDSPGRRPTDRSQEDDLQSFCAVINRVVKAGFGTETTVTARIFQESIDTKRLPIRMVRIDVGISGDDAIEIVPTAYKTLWDRLKNFTDVFRDRVYRGYKATEDGIGISVYFIKPDQKRYWLHSVAFQDADKICSEISTVYHKFHQDSLPKYDEVRKVA